MIEKNKIYSKYLDKNSSKSIYKTSNSFQLYNKGKIKQANDKNKIVIHDELDLLNENIYENYGDEFNPTVINPNNNEIVNITEEERNVKYKPPSKWIEINEENIEDHEDEVRAFEKAKNDYDKNNSDSDEEQINKKRKRHDTDDEDSVVKEKNDTEDELDELLPQQDEDGDIIIDDKVTGHSIKNGLISLIDYKANKKIKKNIFDEISKKPVINETVYRDKEGRKIKKSETKEEKQKKLKELNELQLQKWMKGIKQAEDIKKKEEEAQESKNEPLARYEIDKTFENELKGKERFGDPMKQLINFNNLKNKDEKEDDSDKIIDISQRNLKKNLVSESMKKTSMKRVCKFKAPPNRYGIEPGYMWDGVDRSNGFEQRLVASRNIRTAQKTEYYKLRTEEM